MKNLAVAALFRDEAPYLREWIEFHLEVGFEYFYLFDNLSADSPRKILEPYIQSGVVELHSWPLEHTDFSDFSPIQLLAYERAIHFARGKFKWLALIDTDEFLFSPKNSLIDTLSRYESFGGVAINWQVFGTSHTPKLLPHQLLIETLTLKLPQTTPLCHKVKSIVRPECVQSCQSAHYMNYKAGYFQVNTDHIPFEGNSSPSVLLDDLRINHYTVRDEHFLHSQKIPRSRKWWNNKSPEEWARYYDSFNAIPDNTIFRFISRLKTRLRPPLKEAP